MHELMFLASIAGLYLMLAISPGPNFLVITMAAVSQSRRHAICIALGVSTASVLWAALAAAGLGVVIAHFTWAHRLLQLVGGLYLLYIGVKIFRNAPQPLPLRTAHGVGQSTLQAYRLGLVTNLTNPKSLVFFSSAFATLFTPGLATWAKVSAVLVVALISISWNLLMATVFSADGARQGYNRAKCTLDRLTGGLLAFFGIRLAMGP